MAKKTQAQFAPNMSAENFAKALKLALRAVTPSPIEICGMVRLEAAAGVVTMMTNDLDREIRIAIDAPDAGVWSAVVDARNLAKIIGKAKGPLIMRGEETEERSRKVGPDTHTWRDTVLHISGAVTATMQGRCVADWPSAPPVKNAVAVDISAVDLTALLTHVRPTISTEQTRYYLNGAFIHTDGGRIVCASTDGHRLSKIDRAAPAGLEFKGEIIPTAAVADMLVMLAGAGEGSIEFALSPSGVTLKAGPVSLVSKIVDGSFPDYVRVIPSNTSIDQWIEFSADELSAAFGQAMACAPRQGEVKNMVRLAFTGGHVELTGRNDDGVSATATLCSYVGDGFEMALNAAYMREAIATIGCERVKIGVSSPRNPIRIESADRSADGRLIVVMPLKAD